MVKLAMRRYSDAKPPGDLALPVPYGDKASGTKVEFLFTVSVEGTNVPDGPTTWNRAEVTSFKIESQGISPALSFQEAYYPHTDPPGGAEEAVEEAPEPSTSVCFQAPIARLFVNGGRAVRIAATEFPDGGSIAFKLTATVHFWRWNGNDVPNTLDHTESFTLEPALTAYNRVLLLATDEEWDGSSYVVTPSPPTQPLYKAVAQASIPLVRPYWATANHSGTPMNDTATASWRENGSGSLTLGQKLKESTAIFAFTHGEASPLHFRASVGPPNALAIEGGQIFFNQGANGFTSPGSELYKYVYENRAIGLPDFQFAIFYSCSLNAGSSLRRSLKFDIGDTIYDWRGAAGFPKVVMYKLFISPRTLDEHSQKLMGFLAQGLPLAWALQKVQGNGQGELGMIPMDSATPGLSMLMQARGAYTSSVYPSGCYARLRHVYLEPQTYNAATDLQRNKWFYLYDF